MSKVGLSLAGVYLLATGALWLNAKLAGTEEAVWGMVFPIFPWLAIVSSLEYHMNGLLYGSLVVCTACMLYGLAWLVDRVVVRK